MNFELIKPYISKIEKFLGNFYHPKRTFLYLTLQFILTVSVYPLNRVFFSVFNSTGITLSQQNDVIPRLKKGQRIEKKIDGRKSHLYQIRLTASQVLVITAEQLGIDIALSIHAPNGRIMSEIDSPNGAWGNEEILIVADQNGDYQLEIKTNDAELNKGGYSAAIKTLRFATVEDKNKYKAYQILHKGNELSSKDDSVSMQAALKQYELASKTFQNLNDRRGQALSTYNLAVTNQFLTNFDQAINYYYKSLSLWHNLGDKSAEAFMQGSLGLVLDDKGEHDLAKEAFEQALIFYRSVGDRKEEAGVFNNIGRLYYKQSQYLKSLDYFNKALVVLRSYKDSGEANVLLNISDVYSEMGDYQKAIDYLSQALPLFKNSDDKNGEGFTYMATGDINFLLGNYAKALNSYTQVLTISQTTGERNNEAQALNNIGKVYWLQGNASKGKEFLEKGLIVANTTGDSLRQAYILNNLSLIYLQESDEINALKNSEKALLLLNSLKNRHGEAQTLNNIGTILITSGETQTAIEKFLSALILNREAKEKAEEANTLSNLMIGWKNLDNPKLAIFYGKQAINIYQDIRSNIKTLTEELQKSFLKDKETVYKNLADILIAQGRVAEAEQVLGMLKEEELFDYLRRDDKAASELKANIALTPTETEAFKRYEEIADSITRIGKEYGELEQESRKFPVGKFPRQAELDKLDVQLADARKVFNKFLDELDATFRNKETKGRDDRVAQISGTKALLDSLNQPRTVIISTIAGEDRLNLIVTTSKINRAHTVDIKAADLNKLIVEFRDAVKNPRVDPRPLGKKLYDVLFPAGLQKDLAGVDADTIVWSLDGTLRYAPIAALWDGQKYLVERYANAVITLASRDKIDKTPAARTNWTALGVGVSKQFENLPALTAVPEELCRVVNDPQKKAECLKLTGGKTGVVSGVNLSDDEFTFQNFKQSLGRYPIVHVASHFSLNAGNESDSYLLLGGGKTSGERKLTIAAVREQLDTKFVGTELLVLSACNTAMTAGENSSGVEIEGFGALAQQQGAKTVLASLWSVADASTRDLMTAFYSNLETDTKIGKAEALRQAQIQLLDGTYKNTESAQKRRSEVIVFGDNNTPPNFKTDPNAPFAHPFYWSPFILFGNWR